jgi:hypothetical protein
MYVYTYEVDSTYISRVIDHGGLSSPHIYIHIYIDICDVYTYVSMGLGWRGMGDILSLVPM